MPSSVWMRAATRVAVSEWPPTANRSSWTPRRVSPSTSHQIATRCSSSGVRPAMYGAVDSPRGAGGSRARSTLPLDRQGSASRTR